MTNDQQREVISVISDRRASGREFPEVTRADFDEWWGSVMNYILDAAKAIDPASVDGRAYGWSDADPADPAQLVASEAASRAAKKFAQEYGLKHPATVIAACLT
jgi:hypothetical protein